MLGFNGGRIGKTNTPFTGIVSDDPNYSNVSLLLNGNETSGSDPNYFNVSLLLNGNGTNGSTTFTDSSSYGHTVTPVGNAQISTAQSKFGGASMYFDGSGDYLEIPPSTEFDFGFGAFTVEAWIYLTANGTTAAGETYWPIVNKHSIYNTQTSTGGSNTAWEFRYAPQQGNKLVFVNRIQASSFTEGTNIFSKYSTAVNLSLNTWYHVAAVRDGTTLKLFLNGQDVTDTNTGNYDWSTINMSLDTGSIGQNKVRVGRILGGSNPGSVVWYAVGYIDDLRITKGVARYTSNFEPPTAQLPDFGNTITDSSSYGHTVTPVGNAQISTTQSKFGGASMYFDGSGDYLTTGPDSSLSLDSGDFTVEAFIYATNLSSELSVIASSRAVSSASDLYWAFSVTSTGQLEFQSRSASQYFARSATSAITVNTWYHVAAVRQNNIITVYVNGVAGPTTVNDGGINLSESYVGVGIFNYPSFVFYFTGYIDDLRITKGVARYNNNFTPPTAELPDPSDSDFSDVSLLLNGNGTNGSTIFTDSSSYGHTVTPAGNAQISTTQSKFGGASMYFDGSGDYLTLTNDASFVFGTGDFTVEMWVYHTSQDSQKLYYDGRPLSTTGAYVALYKTPQNKLALYVNAANRIVGTTSILQNAWYHIAVCRQGSSTKLFLNGIQEGSTFTDTTNYLNGTSRPIIGADGTNPSVSTQMQGYIDDLRVTKGVARYTSNFTPPTAELPHPNLSDPDFSDVSLLLHGNGTNGSTTFIDSSSNSHTVTANGNAQISTTQSKFGDASMYFDGSGYLALPNDQTAFNFGTNDFTIESWIYHSGGVGNIFSQRHAFDNNNTGMTWRTNQNSLQFFYGNGLGNFSTPSGSLSTNTWNHIALTRNGNTFTMWINGQSKATNTITASMIYYPPVIGRVQGVNAEYFTGYLDDLRITKGIARYTSNFTPPTAQLPDPSDSDLSSVSLLLHGNGTNGSTTFIDSSSNSHTVTANGNAQISTTQSKFGGASMYFDGNGDYLSIPSSNSFNFGSGDFTIEAWIYLTSYPVAYLGQYYIASIITKDSLSDGRSFTFNLSGTSTSWTSISVTLFSSNSSFIGTSATTSFNLNTWYHVAAIRNGSILRLYKDGVDVGGGTNAISVQNTATVVTVGSESPYFISQGNAYYFPGYIDDLRITKGVARYTSKFTPPTAQLSDSKTIIFTSGFWTLSDHIKQIRNELSPGFVPPVPSIVTDGLVLHLDAGDSASYPGSGTTWFDLTTNSNNGTITGATYSSNESGYLDFDGVNDYVNFASNTLTSSATEISCFLWVYLVSDGIILAILGESSVSNPSYRHSAIEIGSSGQLRMSLWHGSLTNRVTSTLSFNTWNNIGFTYSGTTLTGYVNGSSVGTTTLTWSKPADIYFGIMATQVTNMGTSAYGDGNVSAFYTYNKALTQSEVTQNFDALKGRYGL